MVLQLCCVVVFFDIARCYERISPVGESWSFTPQKKPWSCSENRGSGL